MLSAPSIQRKRLSIASSGGAAFGTFVPAGSGSSEKRAQPAMPADESYQGGPYKGALTPPPAAFPVAWGILYALMGAGAARVAAEPPSNERAAALRTFYFQLGANFLWSILFFNLRAYGAAFLLIVLLWALIVWMTLSLARLDRIAAVLQIPYLLWVLFAGYLNMGVWFLNR